MRFVWLIVGIVLAGLLLGSWASRKLNVAPSSQTGPLPVQQPSTGELNQPEPAPAPILAKTPTPRPNPRLQRLPYGRNVQDSSLTNWEDRIEQILTSETELEIKAQEMLGLFPRLPPEGQVDIATHLDLILPDRDYAALSQYATNGTLAEPVLDVLLTSVVGRPDSIRLPVLLTIATDEQHPKSGEALEMLEAYVGETYGTNWDRWSASIDQRLNAPPAESDEEMVVEEMGSEEPAEEP